MSYLLCFRGPGLPTRRETRPRKEAKKRGPGPVLYPGTGSRVMDCQSPTEDADVRWNIEVTRGIEPVKSVCYIHAI